MLTQGRELHHGREGDRGLFVSGGDRAAAFRPSDTALEPIASAVELRIEGSCAALAHVAAGAGWDHGPDMALTQRAEDRLVAVGLIASQVLRPRRRRPLG
jgi:hypothetical protein